MRWPSSDFESRRIFEQGPRVLAEGLPELPEPLNDTMCIPVAYWTAAESAVVLFLHWDASPIDGKVMTSVWSPQFLRDGGSWRSVSPIFGHGWGTDPINGTPTTYALGGRSICTGGEHRPHAIGPGCPFVVMGEVAALVTELSVVQSTVVRRRLDSHFGAWVVCMEEAGPYAIEAYDSSGELVGRIEGSAQPADVRRLRSPG